jgi:hypothetical protein
LLQCDSQIDRPRIAVPLPGGYHGCASSSPVYRDKGRHQMSIAEIVIGMAYLVILAIAGSIAIMWWMEE